MPTPGRDKLQILTTVSLRRFKTFTCVLSGFAPRRFDCGTLTLKFGVVFCYLEFGIRNGNNGFCDFVKPGDKPLEFFCLFTMVASHGLTHMREVLEERTRLQLPPSFCNESEPIAGLGFCR
jgi:hypothetical protein